MLAELLDRTQTFAVSFVNLSLLWLVQSSLLLSLAWIWLHVSNRRGAAYQSTIGRIMLLAVLVCPLTSSALGLKGFTLVQLPGLPQSPTNGPSIDINQPSMPIGPVNESIGNTLPTASLSDASDAFPPSEPQADATPLPISTDDTSTGVERRSNQDLPGPGTQRAGLSATGWFAEFTTRRLAVGAMCLYLLIALVLLVRLLRWQLQVMRLCRGAADVDTGTTAMCLQLAERMRVRPPRVLCTPLLSSPCLVGAWQPTIILNEQSMFESQATQLRETFMHELAHIKRHDNIWNWVRLSLTALGWFQPMMWWLSRRLEALAEEACDDYVIELGGDRQRYAQQLVDLAGQQSDYSTPVCLGIVSRPSNLQLRVERILDASRPLTTRVVAVLFGRAALLGLIATAVVSSLIAIVERPVVLAGGAPQQVIDSPAKSKHEITLAGEILSATGKPVEGAQVVVTWQDQSHPVILTSDANGRVTLVGDKRSLGFTKVVATKGDLVGLAQPHKTPETSAPKTHSFTAMLFPTRRAQLRVVDAQSRPVAGATVGLSLLRMSKEFRQTTIEAQTDADGLAVVQVPENFALNTASAWKNGQGFDYRSFAIALNGPLDQHGLKSTFKFEDTLQLTLDGANSVTVKVVDDDGQPLSGAQLFVWYVERLGQPQYDTGMFNGLRLTSDEQGLATFAWLPQWVRGKVTIWCYREGFAQAPIYVDPKLTQDRYEIALGRLSPVAGHVTFPDGKPARGMEISATGAKRQWGRTMATATTDADGRYELNLEPDTLYQLVVRDQQWAAASHDGLVLHKGQPVADKDFQLRKATRIYGTLVEESTRKPLPNQRIIMYQYGKDLAASGETLPKVANPILRDYFEMTVQPIEHYSATTDADGKFEFSVGDGNFDIRPPLQKTSQKFSIAGDSQKEFNLTEVLETKQKFSGQAFDAQTSKPVTNALVVGISKPTTRLGGDWQTITDQDGRFEVSIKPGPQCLYALASDGTAGGFVELHDPAKDVRLELRPLGSAVGRLVDDTNQPRANVQLSCGIEIRDLDGRGERTQLLQRLTTDSNGMFAIEKLIPGVAYTLLEEARLGTLIVQPNQKRNLGDVQQHPKLMLYDPSKLPGMIEQAFGVEGTPLERWDRALETLRRDQKQLLICFGRPQDKLVQQFMKLRYEDATLLSLGTKTRVMSVATDEDRLPAAQALASRLAVKIAEAPEDFDLVLVDSRGKVIENWTSQQLLSDDGQLSIAKLVEVFRR